MKGGGISTESVPSPTTHHHHHTLWQSPAVCQSESFHAAS